MNALPPGLRRALWRWSSAMIRFMSRQNAVAIQWLDAHLDPTSKLGRRAPGRCRRLPPRPEGSLIGRPGLDVRPINFPQRSTAPAHLSHLPSSNDLAALARRLRRSTYVTVDRVVTQSAEASEVLLSLAAAGTPLAGLSETPAHLDSDLSELLQAPFPGDGRERELHSIRIRRRAFDVLAASSRPAGRPGVSVLLASMRPEAITRAVEQVRRQRGCDVQLIIGLHGDHWATEDERRVAAIAPDAILSRHDASTHFGEVLNQLTERADSPLVTKWDDDDMYGADHLGDLVRAHAYSGADIVGKAAEFVYLAPQDVTLRRFSIGAESYSWTLAGGTLLMSRRVIESLGGWPSVKRSVDKRLLAVAREAGATAYRTHGFQYILVRGDAGLHTWGASADYFVRAADTVRPGLDAEFADIEDEHEPEAAARLGNPDDG